MSDIFENDIDDENINLSALEESETTDREEDLVFDTPLYCLRL